jgi:DNA-directed RNA polymerase specialized sigma24 family protein
VRAALARGTLHHTPYQHRGRNFYRWEALVRDAARVLMLRAAPRVREVARLKYLDGLSYGDISEKTGLPTGTIKRYIRRFWEPLKRWI